MINFTWWVNRKDAQGRNVFQGGFLGLDNIGVFDRSQPLPTGGFINQADGTAWMAKYSLNLMRIGLELAIHDRAYEDIAIKFFEHFLGIAKSMTDMAGKGIGLWDETDGFYYDELSLPDGNEIPLKVRSLVGLIPLFAVEVLEPELLAEVPEFAARLRWVLDNRPDLSALVSRWFEPGRGERRLLSLLRGHRMKLVLRRLLDESEFMSPYGVRGLSKAHRDHPYTFRTDGHTLSVGYVPGDSDTGMFGGNSNWRGPVWFPVNFLIIEALQKFHHYYGDEFTVEYPTGSGQRATLLQVAVELTRRFDAPVPARQRRQASLFRLEREAPDRPAFPGLFAIPRILPRGQRHGTRRQSPDGMDGARGEADEPAEGRLALRHEVAGRSQSHATTVGRRRRPRRAGRQTLTGTAGQKTGEPDDRHPALRLSSRRLGFPA